MEKKCAICGDKATKIDYNNEGYCSLHIRYGKKSEKKVKRVKLNEDEYWEAVREGALKNMDVHSHIADLIKKDVQDRKKENEILDRFA